MNLEILTELPFVILRLLKVEDAENLFRLVNENRESLRKWLPWLDETGAQSDQPQFIQTCSECAAAGTQFHYGYSRSW
jgi:ribosomal-protein-serine acetyltransferase